jgi:hypothetical protein
MVSKPHHCGPVVRQSIMKERVWRKEGGSRGKERERDSVVDHYSSPTNAYNEICTKTSLGLGLCL